MRIVKTEINQFEYDGRTFYETKLIGDGWDRFDTVVVNGKRSNNRKDAEKIIKDLIEIFKDV